MRLTEYQKNTILNACQRYFDNATCWLFGSRVDDQKRGGDIDLYIETTETDINKIVAAKLAFLVALNRELGEQKIDVVIHQIGREFLPIHQIVKQTGIRL